MIESTQKGAKRVIVAVIGGTLVLLGVAMLIFPGPGILAIAAGLSILALEFAWARSWLARLRRKISDVSRDQRVKHR